MSTRYDFKNEQVEPPVLTQLPEDDILNRDLADAQSEEENSDYDNNADDSGDDTPFPREDGDEKEENEGPDLTREYAPPPVRPRVYESQVLSTRAAYTSVDSLSTRVAYTLVDSPSTGVAICPAMYNFFFPLFDISKEGICIYTVEIK
nr:uncharacterized protein LOC117281026 [Nicotiana tomentosiformis]